MAFHHTPVLPYDLDSRDARWPAVALNVSSLFGCGFVQQKKIIIPHSGTKYFFLDLSFHGSQGGGSIY